MHYCGTDCGDFSLLLKLARSNSICATKNIAPGGEDTIAAIEWLARARPSQAMPLLPLVYQRAKTLGFYQQLSPDTQDFLHRTSIDSIATDMSHRQHIAALSNALSKKGIPIILLKGAAFAESIYPQHAPRPGADVDILVRESDFAAARQVLMKMMDPVTLDVNRPATHAKLFEHVFLTSDPTPTIVELHRALTNPYIFTIDEPALWESSRPHPSWGSDAVRVLSAEHSLLHLAVHAFRDLNFCTHNLLDTHEVYSQWTPDTDLLQKIATEWGARHVLYYLLDSTRTIMATDIPSSLTNVLAPNPFSDQLNRVVLNLSNPPTCARHPAAHRLTQLVSQICLPDKAAHGLRYQLSYLLLRIKDKVAQRKHTP